MQIYAHTAGNEDPELIEVEDTVLVRELVVGHEGDMLWIEEQDEVLDLDTTLVAAGMQHRHHVHRGRCHRVDVRVRYGGEHRSEAFGPSATIGRVFRWVTEPEGFNLTAEERAKHVLALPGADHALDMSVHVGSLVDAGECAVVLDLIPKERFEG